MVHLFSWKSMFIKKKNKGSNFEYFGSWELHYLNCLKQKRFDVFNLNIPHVSFFKEHIIMNGTVRHVI